MTEPADPRIDAIRDALTEKQAWLEWGGVARVAVEAIDRLSAADAVLTPPDAEVEAAARALHQADGNIGKLSWDDWLGDEARETYRELARAALRTARAAVVSPPPSELVALLRAARREIDRWGYGDTHYGVESRDTGVLAMLARIDAALAAVVSPPDTSTEYIVCVGDDPVTGEPVYRRVVRDENENTK